MSVTSAPEESAGSARRAAWAQRGRSVVGLARRVPFTATVVAVMIVLGLVTGAFWSPIADRPGAIDLAYGPPTLLDGHVWTLVTGALLAGHPAVYDVVVTSRPSARWGSEVVALIQLADGEQVDADSILIEAARHIARYKLPKAIVFCDRVQRSPSGKADYRWAKAQAAGRA